MKAWKAFLLALLAVAVAGAVGVSLLLWRGFRATTEPSRFETVVARTVRNLAIPGRARNQKNPLQGTSEHLREGRQDFLARCASCHGQDGSGLTPLGRHLYPRVPDLRSPDTQRLTDGDIHYIIENGVELTGMPAWGDPRATSGDELWSLVLYVRSLEPPDAPGERGAGADHGVRALHRLTGVREVSRTRSTSAGRRRRWPTSCATSASIPTRSFPTWPPTPSRRSRGTRSPSSTAACGSSATSRRSATTTSRCRFNGKSRITSGAGTSRPQGADWWVPLYPADNMKRPTGPTCDGCHSVGYDIHTKQVAEWNVGCERCHGPGSEHVAHPTRGNIVNPAHMDPVASSDTCIQCHSQGRPLTSPIEGQYYDWPVGYHVGTEARGFLEARGPHAGGDEFLLLRRRHRAQEPDAGQRFRAERHVPPRNHVRDVPRRARHGQLRAARQARHHTLSRLPRSPIAERAPGGDARGAHAPQGRQRRQPVRRLPHAGD